MCKTFFFVFSKREINQKGWGYLRASRVTIYIYSSNKRVLWCRSEHDALRWCAPYVAICTKLRLLALFAHAHFCVHIHNILFIFQADCWFVHIHGAESRRGKKAQHNNKKLFMKCILIIAG